MIIIDNMPHSFGFQIENGVPCLGWKSDPNDEELLFLTRYLLEGLKEDDFRTYNRKRFHLYELMEDEDPSPTE